MTSLTVPVRVLQWWERTVRVLVVGVVSLSVAGVALAMVDLYRPVLLVPIVVVMSAGLLWCWHRSIPIVVDRGDDGWAWIAGIVGIAVCVALNVAYSGTFVLVVRDPAFFNILGLDLAQTGDLVLDGPAESLRSVQGLLVASQAMHATADNANIYVQGLHGHEAVTAPAAWIGGQALFLRATALLGGVALVVLRRVLVRVTSPWIATTMTLVLAASLPFAEFTRSPYSEIVVIVCVLGALLAFLGGPAGARRTLVVAFVAAASVTVRIDSLLIIAGFLAALWLAPVVIARRHVGRAEAVSLGVGLAVPIAIGLLDGYNRSPHYMAAHSSQMRTQWAFAGLVVAGAALIHLGARMFQGRTRGRRVRAVPAGPIVAAIVALAVAYWALAPLLLRARGFAAPITPGIQDHEGLSVDPTRSYSEASLLRLQMNFGTLMVLFAIAGTGVVVNRLLRDRDRTAAVLIAIALPAVPYLVRNSITPDMPWALRRFFPVVIPMMLILGAIALERMRSLLAAHRTLFGLLLLVVLAAPVAALAPTIDVRPHDGSLAWVEELCAEVPAEAEVVFVTDRWLRQVGLQTIGHFCELDAVSAEKPSETAAVARDVAERIGSDQPLVFLTSPGDLIPGFDEVIRTRVDGTNSYVTPTLTRLPRTTTVERLVADVVVAVPA